MDSAMAHVLIVSIGNFVEGYLLIVLLDAFFSRRMWHRIHVLGIILVHGLFMSLLNVLFSPGSLFSMIWMVVYWVFAAIYLYGRVKIYRYFLITMLFMVIVVVTEMMGFFVVLYLGLSMFEVYENISLYLAIFTLTKLIQFFIIKKLNYARLKKGLMKKLHMMTIGIIFVMNLVIIVLLFDIINSVDPDNVKLLNQTIILTLVIVVVNVLLYRVVNYLTIYIEREFKEQMEKQYYKSETNHIMALKEQATNFRKERHDIRNHLGAILALTKSGHPDRIEGYINDMLVSQEETLIYKTDSAIEAIIRNKVTLAEQRGIRTQVDLKIPPEGQLKEYDMAIIVGNAMDNAIEACSEAEDKYITIGTSIKQGYFNVKIVNSAEVAKKQLNGKFKTSKEDKDNHGFGLNNIENVVKNNEGFMKAERYEDYFVFKCSMLLGRHSEE